MKKISFTINGVEKSIDSEFGDLPLLDYLHDIANLTGTKFGCGKGICRACTVVIQSSPEGPKEEIQSCSYPLSGLHGMRITTVEGLKDNGKLHPLQKAFLEHFSFQCGYCTPGFLMSGIVLLDHLKDHTVENETEIERLFDNSLGQHICRCTGYTKYYDAIKDIIRQQENEEQT